MIIKPVCNIKGIFEIPGDKSISHRAVMFGAIAKGTTRITNFLKGADCFSTIECFRAMGIEIEETNSEIIVHGKGLRGLQQPVTTLDVGNSGTTTRLISGILSGQDFETILSGDASLNMRPMKRVQTPLSMMGANITSMNHDGCAPLHIAPNHLHGIIYHSPVASAQVKSAILLAGLYADNKTTVIEPSLSRNHTELMLKQFGATIESNLTEVMDSDGHTRMLPTATISPCEDLYAQDIVVPGDISSAAYFIAAALLVPGSEVLVKNVGINPTRAGILEVCNNMGANIAFVNERSAGGEPVADLLVRYSKLHATTIEGDIIPTLIDEIPMIAVMAALADGTTIIRDAAELKVKESNRIDTVVAGLSNMGVDITPTEDGMIIKGSTTLHGATIDSYMDHRIAMAFAIAGLVADGETTIVDSHCVDISFPDFWNMIDKIIVE
ncbi:MAG: 3-phosphoshikimate 1-carboxyvinyltransferase [Eubacteriales bacterium]